MPLLSSPTNQLIAKEEEEEEEEEHPRLRGISTS
jgi:hypothetical protein